MYVKLLRFVLRRVARRVEFLDYPHDEARDRSDKRPRDGTVDRAVEHRYTSIRESGYLASSAPIIIQERVPCTIASILATDKGG